MPVYGHVSGVVHAFEPSKDKADRGTLSLRSGVAESEPSKEYTYRRIEPDSLELHVGYWTSFHTMDGVITGYLLR